MKIFLGAALAALVLSAPVLATAATMGSASNQPTMVAANDSGASHPYAVLDYQDGTHLMPTAPVSRNAQIPYDHTMVLVNRTGGER